MAISRSTLVRLLLVVPLLAVGIALGVPAPAAAATVCDTTATGPQSGVVIKDSVVVKAGTTCNLTNGSVIRGGVTVEPGGVFIAEVRVEIRGSVTATAPGAFILFDVVVRGSVTVTGGPTVRELVVRASQVRGDLVVAGYTIDGFDPFFVLQNTVRGSVVVRNNASVQSPIIVQANVIDGNLDCSGNSPAPTNTFSTTPQQANIVGGSATGQCAGLVGP